MHGRLLPLLLCSALLASSGLAAAKALLTDPAGDVEGIAATPPSGCGDAVDILSADMAWAEGGLRFTLAFSDLSGVTTAGIATDASGRCFYSYTEFQATLGNETVEDAVYIDYVGTPAFVTGWRSYLHGSGLEVPLEVDEAAGTLTATVPFSELGNATLGGAASSLRVQATTALDGAGLTYASDFAPDDGACECRVELAPAAAVPEPAGDGDGEASNASPGPELALVAVAVLAALGLRRK